MTSRCLGWGSMKGLNEDAISIAIGNESMRMYELCEMRMNTKITKVRNLIWMGWGLH